MYSSKAYYYHIYRACRVSAARGSVFYAKSPLDYGLRHSLGIYHSFFLFYSVYRVSASRGSHFKIYELLISIIYALYCTRF